MSSAHRHGSHRGSLRRVFVVFTAGFLLVMALLGGLTVYRVQRILEDQEKNFQQQLVRRVEGFLEQRARTARLLIRYLYADGFYLEEIGRLLEEGYSSYLKYTLRAFADKQGFAVQSIQRYFSLYRDIHPAISRIVLSDLQGVFIYQFDDSGTRIVDPNTVRFKLNYVTAHPRTQLLPAHRPATGGPDAADSNESNRVFGFVVDLPHPINGEPMGRLYVDFDVESIADTYREYADDLNSSIYIVNTHRDLIFDGTREYSAGTVNDLLPATAFAEQGSVDPIRRVTSDHITIGHYLTGLGAVVLSQIDRGAIARETAPITVTITVFIGVSVIVGALMLWTMRTRIERQVRTILDGLAEVEQGRFDVSVPRLSNQEFDDVARGVERMARQLSDYIRRAFLYQLEERNAELNFLQEQVNPHFLYNALEAVRMKAVADGSHETGEMLYALGTLFRRMVKDARVVVTVEEEIAFASEYLQLFRVRQRGNISFETTVAPDVASLAVPKLVLQPLVENYIVHGFDPRQTVNRLTFSAERNGDTLHLKLQDNGKGVAPQRKSEIDAMLITSTSDSGTTRSVGLRNVNRRLSLAFGDKARVAFDAGPGKGSTVSLYMPALGVEEMRAHVHSTDSG